MTWGGGFLQSFLLEKAKELNVPHCECVNNEELSKDSNITAREYARRRQSKKGIYHGEFCRPGENCTYEIVRKYITYPYKLSKLLDVDELIDLSKPGRSCQYVVRTTIDFFLERLDEDLSDYIVIPQFPNGNRFEYWNDDIYTSSGPPSKGWQSYMIAHSNSKDIVHYFGNEMYSFYNMTNSLMQLGSFLKENNIRYYLSTEGQAFSDLAEANKIVKRRIEYIDTNYSILGGEIYNSRLVGKEVPFEEVRIPGDGHYSEDGHTVAANNIYRLINDR